MGKSAIVLLALLVAALALSLPACGTDDESRAPATTVHNDPVQTNEDRAEEEVGEEESDDDGDGNKKAKAKKQDRGKSRGNGHD